MNDMRDTRCDQTTDRTLRVVPENTMTVDLNKLNIAKTVKDLHAAGITEEMIVGVCKTTYVQRVKSLERGKEQRQLLAALAANPDVLAKIKAQAKK